MLPPTRTASECLHRGCSSACCARLDRVRPRFWTPTARKSVTWPANIAPITSGCSAPLRAAMTLRTATWTFWSPSPNTLLLDQAALSDDLEVLLGVRSMLSQTALCVTGIRRSSGKLSRFDGRPSQGCRTGPPYGARSPRDLRQAARLVSRGRDAYDSDEMLRLAAEALTHRIGEAAGRLSQSFQTEHPDVPWRAIRGMRNVVAHNYGRVDQAIMWNTLRHDLPRLVSSMAFEGTSPITADPG